ncbi:MAG: hypothetical protein ATN36_01005 [Epulopiscium sp. Nele67-Bin005]|nr:MAG: hypothetical protein ATN36_01005 [Epulopiscium sp. Nele67-Bin005]
MTLKEQQLRALLKEYDFKRTANKNEHNRRKEEIYNKIPKIADIDMKFSKIGLNLVREMLQNPQTDKRQVYEDYTAKLHRDKKQLLAEGGYTIDYLEPLFECSYCEDTGYIGQNQCQCFKKALLSLAYKQSNLGKLLERENFGTFNFNYFSEEIDPQTNTSQLKNMHEIYADVTLFMDNFKKGVYENIIFYGSVGTGKTFLCNCIAHDILNDGFSVLYFTSAQFFNLINDTRFNRDELVEDVKTTLETLYNVDLLILDDLGSEFKTDLTSPDLFNTLNSRHLNQKCTIISTNLRLDDIDEEYSARVSSRIAGNYVKFEFFGNDIRKTKTQYPH